MNEADQLAVSGNSIVLYDGVCGLCNRIVRLLLRLDTAGRLRYTPLETPLAAELLAAFPAAPLEPEGVILIVNALTPQATIHRRFDAVAEALRQFRGPLAPLGALLRLIPRPVREWSYGLIARHRYQIFGKFDTCPIPTPSQRSRILGLRQQ